MVSLCFGLPISLGWNYNYTTIVCENTYKMRIACRRKEMKRQLVGICVPSSISSAFFLASLRVFVSISRIRVHVLATPHIVCTHGRIRQYQTIGYCATLLRGPTNRQAIGPLMENQQKNLMTHFRPRTVFPDNAPEHSAVSIFAIIFP